MMRGFIVAPILFAFFVLLAVAVGILVFVFWIIMLIDCLKKKFKSDGEKVAWILVLIFASWIGAIIYYFMIYRK
jgi:hypothetical protein